MGAVAGRTDRRLHRHRASHPERLLAPQQHKQQPAQTQQQRVPRSTRANPFPKVRGLICRLPLPALIISSRGCSPWGPDAVIGTLRRGFLHTQFTRNCASRQLFTVRPRRTGRQENPGALPDRACFSRQADSTQCSQRQTEKITLPSAKASFIAPEVRHRIHIRVQECQPAALSPVM